MTQYVERAHHRQARFQPLARASRGSGHPPLDRDGLRLQRLLASAQRAVGVTSRSPAPTPWDSSSDGGHTCDLEDQHPGWMFTLFFVFLGSSAAVFGRWLEHRVPGRPAWWPPLLGRRVPDLGDRRPPPTRSGSCGSARRSSAACGLGLGYISPVRPSSSGFPRPPRDGTGMAIMGSAAAP